MIPDAERRRPPAWRRSGARVSGMNQTAVRGHGCAEAGEDPEHGAPGRDGDDQGADDGGDHWGESAEGLQDRHDSGEQVSAGHVDDHGAGHRGGDAAADALHDPGHDQHPDGGGEGAAEGAEHADQPADDEWGAASGLVGPWSAGELAGGEAEEERGEGEPDEGRGGGQVCGHPGERRGVHVGGERGHRGLQGDGADQGRGHRDDAGDVAASRAVEGDRHDGWSSGVVVTTSFPVAAFDSIRAWASRIWSRLNSRAMGTWMRPAATSSRKPCRTSAGRSAASPE